MKEFSSHKIIHIVLFTLILLLFYKILSPLSDVPLMFSDSLSESFCYHELTFLGKIRYLFMSNPHNYFIMSFFHILGINYLPNFFRIHPMDFAKLYFFYIFLGILLINLWAILKNFTKYFNEKSFSYLLLPIFFFMVITANYETNNLWFFVQDVFMYTYYFLPVFAILLFKQIESSYVKNDSLPKYIPEFLLYFCMFCVALALNLPNFCYVIILFLIPFAISYINKKLNREFHFSKKNCIFSILLIAVGVSGEFFRFIIISGFVIGYFLHIIFANKGSNIKKSIKYYIPIFATMVITIFTNIFFNYTEERTRSLQELIELFPNFCHQYIQIIFSDNLLLFKILILLIILSFIFVKNTDKNKRLLIFTSSILTSCFLFFLVMYPFKIAYDDTQNLFIINHNGLTFSYQIVFLNLIFSYIGYILAFSKSKMYKATTILLAVVLIASYTKIKTDFSFERKYFFEMKKSLYMFERLFINYTKYTKEGYSNYEEFRPPYYSLQYYVYSYTRGSIPSQYKLTDVCKPSDADYPCNDKMRKIVEEKSNYVFSDKELTELNFSIYNKYKIRRKR